MNFKLKTMLLVLGASTIPFILISFVFIYQTAQESRQFVRTEFKKKVEHMAGMIGHEIKLIQNDLGATANMDVMADMATYDIDRRIYDVLMQKKEAFSVIGDYYVCDANNSVIVSTNDNIKQGQKLDPRGMFQKAINPRFGIGGGFIYLNYSVKNADKFLYSTILEKIRISQADKSVPLVKDAFSVKVAVPLLPGYVVVGELGNDTSLERAKEMLLLYLLGGFAVVAVFAYIFASRISRPILALSEKVGEIAGSKEYSKRLSITSNDELSKVSAAFNNLLDGIEDALKSRLRLAEEQSKSKTLEEMAKKLSKYISPQLVESIFSGEQEARLESKRKKLTIFFSDIVNFTATTDTMEAEDLSALLNHYLNEMSHIALKHGATIDKFIGDAVMVFFGDPKSNGDKEDALSCVKMALEMKERLSQLAEYWRDKGIAKPFRVRFGIHTGYCTVGNFGNEERMEYTIIGGAVNLASRIETQAAPDQILVSEETYLLVRGELECRYVDKVSVKGISADVKLYEVEGLAGRASSVYEVEDDGLRLRINYNEVKDKLVLKNSLLAALENIESTKE